MSCQHSCKFPNGNVRALQHQPLWCLYFSGVNLTLCSRSWWKQHSKSPDLQWVEIIFIFVHFYDWSCSCFIYWTECMLKNFGNTVIRLPGTTIDNLPIPLTMTLSACCINKYYSMPLQNLKLYSSTCAIYNYVLQVLTLCMALISEGLYVWNTTRHSWLSSDEYHK